MQIKLFDLKAKMIRDGVECIDFLENTFTVNYLSPTVQVSRVFLVQDRHLLRPDLLSFDAYGSPNYVDVLLKFSQITNPFSMELNDIIVAPNLTTLEQFYSESKQVAGGIVFDTKSLFIDPARASQKDEARIKQLEKIAVRRKSGASEIKPTSLLRKGEVAFDSDGNAVRLAPNTGTKKKPARTKGTGKAKPAKGSKPFVPSNKLNRLK